MERFKSLFGIRKNTSKRRDNENEDVTANHIEWSAEQEFHADFIHPTQFEQDQKEDHHPNGQVEFNIFDIQEQHSSQYSKVEVTNNTNSIVDQIPPKVEPNGNNGFEFIDSANADSSSQLMSYPTNIGWIDFAQASIEFEEVSPSAQWLDQLVPEGSRLEDYSTDLAVQYGHRRKLSQRIFYSILEDFPHYQSYLAISRLVESGFSLEIIYAAYELKSIWRLSPDFWLVRSNRNREALGYANVRVYNQASYQLTWDASARLCSIYGFEEVVNLISNFWKREWVLLNVPSKFSDRETSISYWYFASFISYKTKMQLSEFPVNISDQLEDDENEFLPRGGLRYNINFFDPVFGLGDFEFSPELDGTVWQDPDFQKTKISNFVEES